MTGSAPFSVTLRRPKPMATTLPFAPAAGNTLLVGANGEPIWPAPSEDAHASLGAVASLFGGTLENKRSRSARAPEEGSEVTGIGNVAAQTKLFAHLTRRRWNVVQSVGELSDSALPEVVLMATPRIDPALIELLMFAPVDQSAPGILWGRTSRELDRQVLTRSAAAALSGPVSARRRDYCALDRIIDLEICKRSARCSVGRSRRAYGCRTRQRFQHRPRTKADDVWHRRTSRRCGPHARAAVPRDWRLPVCQGTRRRCAR